MANVKLTRFVKCSAMCTRGKNRDVKSDHTKSFDTHTHQLPESEM